MSKQKDPIINCHTHILTSYSLPNGLFLYPLPVLPLLRNKVIRWILVQLVYLVGRFLSFFTFDGLWDLLKNRAERALSITQMLDLAQQEVNRLKAEGKDFSHVKGNQEIILEYLKQYYNEGTKFVVLSLDTEFMGKGQVPKDFRQQLDELSDLQRKNAGILFPFIHAEPRRDNVTDLVKEYIQEKGFKGIKIYPPYGIHPNDERLHEIYQFAVDHDLPVTGHCTPDGMKGKVYKIGNNILADPDNYLEVLQAFPKLKLCLAHFGGDSEWKRFLDDPWDPHAANPHKKAWISKIIDMIYRDDENGDPQFPNLYVDVSYTSFNNETRAYLKVLLDKPENQRLRARVLFGSDFYVLQTEISERAFAISLRAFLGEVLFDQIARENPKKFLNL